MIIYLTHGIFIQWTILETDALDSFKAPVSWSVFWLCCHLCMIPPTEEPASSHFKILAWGDGWVSQDLACKHEDLSSYHQHQNKKLGIAVCICNPRSLNRRWPKACGYPIRFQAQKWALVSKKLGAELLRKDTQCWPLASTYTQKHTYTCAHTNTHNF